MRKLIVPLFLCLCLLLAGVILYAGVLLHYKKQPQYTEYDVRRELSLSDVQRTNITMQPDVDYFLVYHMRDYRYTQMYSLKRQIDTLNYHFVAVRDVAKGGKPMMPEKVNWGTLK